MKESHANYEATDVSGCLLGNCTPFQDEKVAQQLCVVVLVVFYVQPHLCVLYA